MLCRSEFVFLYSNFSPNSLFKFVFLWQTPAVIKIETQYQVKNKQLIVLTSPFYVKSICN